MDVTVALFYKNSILFCFIICCFSGSLEVKGPSEPILEGQDVTLECVDSESELNMSTVHFQRFSKVRSRTQCSLTCTYL